MLGAQKEVPSVYEKSALNEAIREGLIDTNPARRLRLPRARRPHAQVWTRNRVAVWRATGRRPAVAVWTTGHLAEFLGHVREDACLVVSVYPRRDPAMTHLLIV